MTNWIERMVKGNHTMTFEEAERELAALAKGEYHAIRYERTTTHLGSVIVKCTVYISEQENHTAPTWRGALDKMIKAIDRTVSVHDTKEAPA